MIRIRSLFIIFVGLTMFFVACGSAPSNSDSPSEIDEADSGSIATLPNMLVDVEGSVEIRRTGWNRFVNASFGTLLRPGDLIRVGEGSQAAVLCGDEATWKEGAISLVASEENGVPCLPGRPPRPWPDVAALRAESEDQSAYIVQPRNSALLTNTPMIFWRSVGEGEAMLGVVSIISDDGIPREPVEIQSGELGWPESWPPLVQNSTYVLLLGEQEPSPEATLGKGFWILDAGQAEQVENLEGQLRSSPLTRSAQDLLIAELYESYGLHAEALALLLELQADHASPALWLMIGRVHLESGLPEEAVQAYSKALALAETIDDLSSIGEAHLGLALAAQAEGDEQSARSSLADAESTFVDMGDLIRLQELEAIRNDD